MTTTTTERRPRLRLSARQRILGWVLGLTVVSVLGGPLLTRQLLLEQRDAEVNRSLEQEVNELRRLAQGRDPETGQPFGADVAALFDTFIRRNLPAEGEVFYTFVDGRFHSSTGDPLDLGEDPARGGEWAELTEPGHGQLSTDEGAVRWLAVTIDDDQGRALGVFVVANFLSEKEQDILAVVNTGLAVSGAMLLVGAVAAWVVAGRILRPIRTVTDTARSITESDLSGRIDTEGHDEVAELARTFNAMLERLEMAFATQQAFIDDAGHELRTPITIVRGHLELLGDDPDERQETIALVTDELDRMSRIVNDLLLLAKLEHPTFLHRQAVEVEPFTHDLYAKLRTLGDRTWRLDEAGVGTASVDPQRLTQAVTNLARNAVEHAPDDVTVVVGSRVDDDALWLWVADDGPGIAPADQQLVFERFARAGDGRRSSDGAGLGLAIVRAVAEAHHGKVLLSSRNGEGSRFTIVLPLRAEGDPWPES